MKGSLSERCPADVLSQVQRLQISGILRFWKDKLVRQIFVDAGTMIRFAASTLPSESMTLLFKEKCGVSDDQIRRATATKQEHELLGTTLVRIGALTHLALLQLTEEHIRRVLHGALLMRDGEYEFQQGALPFREQLDGGKSAAEILLEWVRDVPDVAWVRKRLGSDEARVRLSDRPPEGYQKIALNPAEGYTMSRVDGSASVREICIVSPMGEETALRALLGLALAGILDMPEGAHDLPFLPAAPPKTATKAPAAGHHPAGAPRGAVLPHRTPGNGGAPKARPAPPRKVTSTTERVRPATSPDLEMEMLDRYAKMNDQNLYQVLDVLPTASADDIRRSYYGFAKRFHPDKFTREEIKAKAEKVFGHITEAYSTLSRVETRKKYDEDVLSRRSPRAQEKTDPGEMARSNFKAGRENLERGKLAEALTFFQNAVEQDGSKAEYFHWLALTQAKNPRWKKDAEANFLKAISMDPSNGVYYAQLGSLYARGGLQSKARDMFQKALQWDPANEEARQGLASIEEGGRKGLLGMFGKK